MSNDLVSIIMLSHNNGPYVEESVRSVFAQTYQNWELIFIDDSSKDNTISQMMTLRAENNRKRGVMDYDFHECRIKVSKNIYTYGTAVSMNSALGDVKGRWVAFLNVGDVWEPTKLERQIAFMEENDYHFTYTKYRLMNSHSKDRGVVVGGKEHITYQDMLKCCWPCYLTVMYDAIKIGRIQVRKLQTNNDYALWLVVCEKVDCYLLPESLAKMRTNRNHLGNFFLTNKLKWRYEVYRKGEFFNPFVASKYTIRNLAYGVWKWMKYVERG